jgi:hypothetical protein
MLDHRHRRPPIALINGHGLLQPNDVLSVALGEGRHLVTNHTISVGRVIEDSTLVAQANLAASYAEAETTDAPAGDLRPG